MNKLAFFLAAMSAGEYRRRAWVISAFALTQEAPDAWKAEPYPYRIVQRATGHLYVNPQNTSELLPIEDTVGTEPPFKIKDRFALTAGQIPNVSKDLETNYGNLLFNYIACIYAFGTKIPYLEGRVSPSQLEGIILPRLVDDPAPGTHPPESAQSVAPIYVSEYLRFADAMFNLVGLTQICVPATTRKSMLAPPGIVELKERLLKENEGRLHDPAVIAEIQKQLIAYDREYLKGDLAEGFLITGKAFNVVRSKLFGMHGAEVGLAETVDVDLIRNSLSQGWDIDKFPAMNNSARAGSYNRGAQTMLGGESVKWLLRASSNMSVTQDDCGSMMGIDVAVTKDRLGWITGFSEITPEGPVRITPESAGSYLGRRIAVRSPMYCNLPKTDYCKVCVGERLAVNPNALSAAISEYGSAFLSMFMAAAHGKQLTTAKLEFEKAIF